MGRRRERSKGNNAHAGYLVCDVNASPIGLERSFFDVKEGKSLESSGRTGDEEEGDRSDAGL